MRRVYLRLALSVGFAVALAGGISAQPAKRGQPYGYWAVNTAPDGIKLGVIFPEFSPNDFAGLVFVCTPGTTTVMVSVDSPRPLRPGTRASVTIAADEARTVVTGKAEGSEMDDQTRVIFTTTMSDPVLATLAEAKTIRFGIGQSMQPLPTQGARKAVTDFLAKCGGAAAPE